MSETIISTPPALPEDDEELFKQQDIAESLWRGIAERAPADRQKAAEAWAAEYGHLFFWCCGSPVFGGREAEEYYRENSIERGLSAGRTVYYYG